MEPVAASRQDFQKQVQLGRRPDLQSVGGRAKLHAAAAPPSRALKPAGPKESETERTSARKEPRRTMAGVGSATPPLAEARNGGTLAADSSGPPTARQRGQAGDSLSVLRV